MSQPRKVFKYEIPPGVNTMELPFGAKILSVGCQGDSLFLWAEVIPTNRTIPRVIEVYGTGHEMYGGDGYERKFIGTALMNGGALVWHVFEKVRIR